MAFSRVPPASKIEAAFRDVDTRTARRIRRILKGKEDPRTVEATDTWVRRCYHEPSQREQAAHAVDVLLETYGVETAEGRFDYCNAGDAYATTLVFVGDSVYIACWGDVIESMERRGAKFS